MDAFPPPGYIPAPSAVEGITIFKPAPVEEKHEDVVEFTCPRCGAQTAYSIEDGGLKCSSCGYIERPTQPAVGHQAEQFEFKVEALEQAAYGWGEARQQIECKNCQAITALAPGQLTQTCPFCGSHEVIQGEAAQDAIRPRFLIPFKLDEKTAREKVTGWLGGSWMVPGALRQSAKLGGLKGIYLPFWTFDALDHARWRAQVGYDQTQTYFQDGEMKTRTVTHWRSESGNVSHNFDDLLVSGTKHVSAGILGEIDDFTMGELAAYDPKYLAGIHAQAYEVTLEDAWTAGRNKMRDQMQEDSKKDAMSHGGDHVRSMSMELTSENESWRYILLPIYLMGYSYGDKSYQVVVNGQTGSVGGSRPVDWVKVIAAGLAPWILVLFAGIVTLLLPPLFVCTGILFFGAIALDVYLIMQALKLQNPDRPTRLKGLKL